MLNKRDQARQDALDKAAASRADAPRMLSQKIFECACANRASGFLEMSLKELAAIAGLGLWQSRVRERVIEMVKEAPSHPPLNGFVSQWSVDSERARFQWNVAAPDEAVH
jgi:hypothetical protein